MPSTVRIQVLPSPIICSGDVNGWEPFEVNGRERIAVFKPVASGGPSRSIHPNIDYDQTIRQIPSDGGKLTTHFVDRMIPTGTDGTHLDAIGCINGNADPSTLEYFPCETITYEVYEPADPVEIQRRFIINLRRATRQVWIGRSASYIDPPMSLSVKLDDNRQTLEEAIYTMGPFTTAGEGALVCTEEIWKEAWRSSIEPTTDHTDDIVHEAQHSTLSNLDRKYFYAGVAVEQIKYRLWDELLAMKKCSRSQRRNAIKDTSKPQRFFAEELDAVVGCSLMKAERNTYETVKQIWIARGLIAHGKYDQFEKLFPPDKAEKLKASCTPALYNLSAFVADILSP